MSGKLQKLGFLNVTEYFNVMKVVAKIIMKFFLFPLKYFGIVIFSVMKL